ncbi:MAG: NYN domain-containing protein [Gemmatimonadetes bacterium]|nr:NYN domain-containing protein [Gemmatimonadota bacterium]
MPAIAAPMVHAPNAALLIDFDNVTMGIRSDLQTELRNLLSSDIIHGKVAVQRAYADWRRYPQYIVPLSEASIDLIFAPAYGSSKKNATDIRLAIDAMELVFTRPEIGTIILLSGDSDFSSLVIKLKEYGKYVIGVGIRESSSDLLVQNCDEYYSYNALAGLVKSGDSETMRKFDPWELVTEAINRMVQNHDVMRSDRLKQVMQDIDSSFDEKNLGMSKFSKFCQEAAHKGLIQVTKLENGQLDVAPTSSAPSSQRAARPAAAEPARADGTEAAASGDAPAREGRSRRGRRGGRGRKRGGAGETAATASAAISAAGDAPETDNESMTDSESLGSEQFEMGSMDATPAAAAQDAMAPVEHAPARALERTSERVAAPRAPRPPRQPRYPEPVAPAAPIATDDSIGVAGLRLTRDEAMKLVRSAVAELTHNEDAVPDEVVRQKAQALLGRDSESLSVRNFARILRDAHDQDIVDLRRRGNAFEVARAAEAASVADQLAVKEQEARAAEPQAPAAPPAPRGMGPRGAPPRGGRGSGGAARNAPPPELLMVGVVDEPPAAAAEKPARPRRPRRPRRKEGDAPAAE